MAPGVVGAPHQRPGLDVAETKSLGLVFQLYKFLRRHITLNTKLTIGRLEILSDSNNVDAVRSQVMQRAQHFIVGFADAELKHHGLDALLWVQGVRRRDWFQG